MANENEQTIKLSAQIDQSFNSMLGLMDSMKSKTMEMASSVSESAAAVEGFANSVEGAESQLQKLGNSSEAARQRAMLLAGIFAAATTAIYKFAKGIFDTELSLQKMAKQQKKTTEAVRASENALQAMGKTLKEVKADKELNKTYQELVKINEQMAMPNINNSIEGLKSLRGAFWELRATAKNVLDWIGARVLTQIEEPVKRITDKLRGVAKWLQNNLDSITMKISSYITGFIKGVEGIVEGFTGILETVNEIDPAIRKIGEAIIFVMGLIKSGPIGQILFLITAIGGVIDDMNNYQRNQRLGLTPDNPTTVVNGQTYQYTETAFTGMWDFLLGPQSEGMSVGERINGVFERILTAVTEGLESIKETLKQFNLFEALFDSSTDTATTLAEISNFFQQEETRNKIQKLFTGIMETIFQTVAAGGNVLTDLLGIVLNTFFGNDQEIGTAIENAFNEHDAVITGFGSGFVTKFVAKMMGANDQTAGAAALAGGLIGMFTKAYNNAEEELINGGVLTAGAERSEADKQKIYDKLFENLGLDFQSIFDLVTAAINKVIDSISNMPLDGLYIGDTVRNVGGQAGGFLGKLLRAIFMPAAAGDDQKKFVDQVLTPLTDDNGLFNALSTGVIARIFGLDTGGSILTGIAELFAEYTKDGAGLEKLKEDFNKIKESVETIWYGTWTDDTHTARADNGLRSLIAPIFENIGDWIDDSGITQWFDNLFQSLAQKAGEWGSEVWKAFFHSLPDAVQDTLKALGWAPEESGPTVTTGDDGSVTIEGGARLTKNADDRFVLVDQNGNEKIIGNATAAQNLAPYIPYMTLANNGRIELTGPYAGLENDSTYGAELSKYIEDYFRSGKEADFSTIKKTFERREREKGLEAPAAITIDDLVNNGGASGSSGSPGGAGANVGKLTMDTSEAEEKINELESRTPETRASLVVGSDEVTPVVEGLTGTKTLTIDIQMGSTKGSVPGILNDKPKGKAAFGGRIGRETNGLTVGEDGPEYIIPITKPSRAAELIKQMFGEMGTSAVSKIIGDLGIGAGGNTIGADYASIASAMGSSASVTNNNTVTAPININVQASGVGAEDVGERAYDAAQRHLLRTLRGVFA